MKKNHRHSCLGGLDQMAFLTPALDPCGLFLGCLVDWSGALFFLVWCKHIETSEWCWPEEWMFITSIFISLFSKALSRCWAIYDVSDFEYSFKIFEAQRGFISLLKYKKTLMRLLLLTMLFLMQDVC